MDLQSVKRLLEKGGDESENASIDEVSNKAKFFDPFILQGIQVDVIEPGRVVCSMKVPLRLLNSGNFLHGGATASLVDIIGSAAIHSVGAPTTGVSIEINVSYLDAAFANFENLKNPQVIATLFQPKLTSYEDIETKNNL